MWFILLALLAISCGGNGGTAENINAPNEPARPIASPGQGLHDCTSSDVLPFGSEIIKQVCVDASGNTITQCFNSDGAEVPCPS